MFNTIREKQKFLEVSNIFLFETNNDKHIENNSCLVFSTTRIGNYIQWIAYFLVCAMKDAIRGCMFSTRRNLFIALLMLRV